MKWIKVFEDFEEDYFHKEECDDKVKNVADDVFNNIQDQVFHYLPNAKPGRQQTAFRVLVKKTKMDSQVYSYRLFVLVKMVWGNIMIKSTPMNTKIERIIKKSMKRFNITLDYYIGIGGDLDHYIYSRKYQKNPMGQPELVSKTYDPSIIYDEKINTWRDGIFNAYGMWIDE